MPSISRHLKSFAVSSFVFIALAAQTVAAGPSGGPYGPRAKTYPIPKAEHVYFVAPDGDPQAAGTDVDAPTTLAAAIARVVTDDAIVLRGGVYRTGSLYLNQGITMQPFEDEQPVLKGTEVASTWEAVDGEVWRTSWTKLFPSEPMFWWRREREEAKTPMHRFNNDLVFFDGQFLQSAGGVDELTPDTYYIDYENKHVYIGRNPAGHTVEITAHEVALTRTSTEVHGKVTDRKGPKIHGITFTQYAWTAFSIEGKRQFTNTDEPVDEPIGPADPATYGKQAVGTLLEDVTIRYCGRVAGYFRGDGLVIRNSLVSDTGTEGIYVIGSSDVLLERNIVLRNNIEQITGYFASAVKIINQTHDVVVRDNLVMDHKNSVGVWYDIGNRNGVFIDNYVEGTDIGFFFEISQGATAAGNVFVNNGNGVRILNSADAHIYNNTFVDSLAQIERTERSAEGDHFGWHPATGPGVEERDGHVFVNNLLVASDAASGPLLRLEQAQAVCARLANADPQLQQLDGNLYVRPDAGGQASPLIDWVDTQASTCKTQFASLAELQRREPGFASRSRQLGGTPRSVFTAPDLRRFELRQALPASKDLALPKDVAKRLGWSRKQAARAVGAYPAP